MDLDRIEKLIELARKHGVHEIEVGDDEVKITLNPPGNSGYVGMPMGQPMYSAPPVAPQPVAAQPAQAAAPVSADGGSALASVSPDKIIKSPFVGTFYTASSPGAEPFCAPGKRVKKGDTLCIVEAMKLMNEIEAEVDGVIKEVLVDNESPVEFDQPLFILE